MTGFNYNEHRINSWQELTTQQLVRYEALFTLLDDIQGSDDIASIASQVAIQWKYFANVSSWRLVIFKKDGVFVIDGFRGEASISENSLLSEWDSYHQTLKRPNVVRMSDAYDGPAPPNHLTGKLITEVMVLPFLRNEHWIALLSVATRHEAFSEMDNKFNRIFGSHIADRISNILYRKEINEALLHKATRDALTGLYNRGAILEQLERCLALSKREKCTVSIILADIDFFKTINDRFGHLAGDHALKEVSRRMQTELRDSDSLGRYGGEEFLLILYPCGPEMIWKAAERFRKAIASLPIIIDSESSQKVEVTISFGTSCSSAVTNRRIDELLKIADNALYQSKANGRNCDNWKIGRRLPMF